MPFTVATWNINSVRLRIAARGALPGSTRAGRALPAGDQVPERPAFPGEPLARARLRHIRRSTARRAITASPSSRVCRSATIDRRALLRQGRHARHIVGAPAISATRRSRLHNFYVPAGGDEPDPRDQPEIRPQARLPRASCACVRRRPSRRRPRSSSAISTSRRWKPTCGRTSSSCKSSATRRSRPKGSTRAHDGRRLGRPDAPQLVPPDEKLYHLVELSRAGLGEDRPAAAASITSGRRPISRRTHRASRS